jgi:LPXTG-motif cell wall-anchored protein
MVRAEGDTFDEDDSEGTAIYAPEPQTGDEMPLGLLSGAMLVSLAGVIVLLLSQRKNKADQAE